MEAMMDHEWNKTIQDVRDYIGTVHEVSSLLLGMIMGVASDPDITAQDAIKKALSKAKSIKLLH